jgi:hypothetical protein
MRRPGLLFALAASLAVALILAAPASTRAQQPAPELTLALLTTGVEDPRAGEEVGAAAYLMDPSGNPIANRPIVFSVGNEFLNVTDQTEIARAMTDESGLAAIFFTPRVEGERTVTAAFAGDEVFTEAVATEAFQIGPGPQLHREVTPFRVPGANVWMVTAILATVWSVYIVAMLFGVHIALSGDSS